MLQDQEVELVLATEDKVAITGLLIRIRILMHEIEKAMFKARPFQLLSLPRCLSSRYIEGSGASLTAPALLERYSTLKQHEFRIALTDIQDMKAVTKSLQERYLTYLRKEFDLFIAINGRSALRQHLVKIQSTICEIEKYMLKYRKSGMALRDAKNAHSPSHVPEPTGPSD
ncbi:hypothetical protein BGZ52_002110 [Haplosporangium bisporale]|nr:hypothetical protein BGZ52_002110 [Haplosporangium bisporale]